MGVVLGRESGNETIVVGCCARLTWGDGIVDVQDLIVIAEHLFEEIPPVESVE